MEEENKDKKVNEPGVLYTSERIKIYSTFEAAAQAEAMYVAQQHPVERVRETVKLILRLFPLPEKGQGYNKIHIDKS